MISNKIYKQILENMPIVTVDLLVVNNKNEILLFKRNNKPCKNIFYTPGGRVLKNEKIFDGLVRKMKEELDLEVTKENVSYCGVIEEFFDDSIYENISSHCVNSVYLYKLNDINKIKLDKQHCEFRWFKINDTNLHKFVKMKINLI